MLSICLAPPCFSRRIPVIITFGSISDLDISDLESKGFDIERTFTEIDAISGTIPASDVTKLAEHSGIKKIEFDDDLRSN